MHACIHARIHASMHTHTHTYTYTHTHTHTKHNTNTAYPTPDQMLKTDREPRLREYLHPDPYTQVCCQFSDLLVFVCTMALVQTSCPLLLISRGVKVGAIGGKGLQEEELTV